MPLIVGLGNPGDQYEKTRHNAGFLVLDALKQQLGLRWTRDKKSNAQVAEMNYKGNKLVLAKPMTYMNNSGMSVQVLAKQFGFAPCDVWVVYDEATLPFGVLRLRLEGSAGGHNGVKSIIKHLGAEDFVRFRLGVNEAPENVPLDKWVLSTFSKEELKELKEINERVADRILRSLDKGLESVTENLSE